MLLATLAVPVTGLTQQAGPPLQAGQRLRVTLTDSALARRGGTAHREATLAWASPDSLVFETAAPAARLAVPWTDVKRVERFGGRSNRAMTGFIIGASAGGLLGVGLLAACSGDDFMCPTAGGVVGAAALYGGLGALVGLLIRHDRWDELTPLPFDVAPAVGERGPGIAVRLEW
jgi:hypothetical protein